MTPSRTTIVVLALIALAGIAPAQAAPAKPPSPAAQPFALLCERGRTFNFLLKSETVEQSVSDEEGKVVKQRRKVQIQILTVEALAGATLIELRTSVDGKPGVGGVEGLFPRRWLAVTPAGVHSFEARKPDASALARELKRQPRWPLRVSSKECIADEEDVNTNPQPGEPGVTHRAGSAGSAVIAGRRAICRCRMVNSPSSVEEEECLDRERGFVRLTYNGKEAGQSSTEWTMTLVNSAPGTPRKEIPPPAPTPRAAAPAKAPPVVPPIDLRPVAAAAAAAAKKLNLSGLRQHQAANYPEAIKLLTSALATHPGHLLARYNLACAYNRSGERAMALALLRQLRAQNTSACDKILRGARMDKDLQSLWTSDELKKITSPR